MQVSKKWEGSPVISDQAKAAGKQTGGGGEETHPAPDQGIFPAPHQPGKLRPRHLVLIFCAELSSFG